MKDLIKSVLKVYLTEQKKNWVEEHCDNSFGDKDERYFCYAATNAFKSDFKLQEGFRNKLKEFTEQNKEEISDISLEILKKESQIAKDGLEELRWVHQNGRNLCPDIKRNIIEIYNNLLGGKYDFYVDSKGEYHILNRLDTNYSALGVMVTEYFVNKDLIYDLRMNGLYSKKSWEKPVFHLIKNILYPHIYRLSNYETNLFKGVDIGENPLHDMFINLLKEDMSTISNRVIKVLSKVREVGFSTEKKFLNLLDKYNIQYKNFGKDYGFVDRFLGVDNFVRLHGEWYPVQVKSSEREKTLIDELGCEGRLVVYPDMEGNFMVNGFTFNRFFCKIMDACGEQDDIVDS